MADEKFKNMAKEFYGVRFPKIAFNKREISMFAELLARVDAEATERACSPVNRLKASTASAHAQFHKERAKAYYMESRANEWRSKFIAQKRIAHELKVSLFHARQEIARFTGQKPWQMSEKDLDNEINNDLG